MDLVVLIATHNRPELLVRTLASLAECELPDNYRETVIIENGGKFGAEEIVKKYNQKLNTRYMYSEPGNKSIALNKALETLNNVLIFFTDDDARFEKNILLEYSDTAKRFESGYFFGGPVYVDYEKEPEEWLKKFLPYSAKGIGFGPVIRQLDEAVFLGINWVAFSEDIRAAGGFNTDLGPGSDSGATGMETDIQKRLLEKGIKGLYLPNAKIWHNVPERCVSEEWIVERIYKHSITKGYYMEKSLALAGIPMSLIKEWFVVRYHMLYQFLRGNREGRFWAYLYKYRVKGMIKGFKQRRRLLNG